MLKNDLLYRKTFRGNRPHLLLVDPKALENDILYEAYDSLLSGHLGIERKYGRVKDRYYFDAQIGKVTRYVTTCESCQFRNEPKNLSGDICSPCL